MKQSGLKVSVRQVFQGHIMLVLEGVLDESAVLPQAYGAEVIELDLEKLKYISSFGIKTWVEWIRQQKVCRNWIIHKARPSVVGHFSKVDGFLPPNTVVESVFAPFISESTFEAKEELLERNVHFGLARKSFALPKPLDSLGKSMVPDFVVERFFEFLEQR